MSIITKMLKQAVVYWAPTGNDRFGKPTWDNPVELRARWEQSTGSVKAPDGETKTYGTIVYVESDVEVGGMILCSPLTSGMFDPREAGAIEIMKFDKLPNFKATEFLRTAYL